MQGRRPGRQSGAGGYALLGAVLALGLMGLLTAWGQAAHPLAALRDGTREAMALQARTAADSGLAFALSRLNEAVGPHAQCGPEAGVSGASFGEFVHRATDRAPGAVRSVAAQARVAEARCEARSPLLAGGEPNWTCVCADGAAPGAAVRPPGDPAGPPRAAFSVRAGVVAQPASAADGTTEGGTAEGGTAEGGANAPAVAGTWIELESAGCVRSDGDCRRAALGLEPAAALRRLQVVTWPALVRLPVAAVTAGGALLLDAGVRVENGDPASGGRVLLAGRAVEPAGARIDGLPGAPLADRIGRWDAAAADAGFDGFVQGLLGLPLDAWQRAPRVRSLDCVDAGAAACAVTLQAWLRAGVEMVAVRGRLDLPAGFELGRRERPVLLVVDGPVSLRGPGVLRGVVLADSIDADGRAGDVDWEGAAVARGDVLFRGRVQLLRPAPLMARMTDLSAGLMPRPGSWREPLEPGGTR